MKTSYSKHVGFLDRLALLVLGGGSIYCLHLGVYLSHMMPNLGDFFFYSPLGQGNICAQLDQMDLG
jgi:hypothetical protein